MPQNLDHVYKKLELMQADLDDLRNNFKGASLKYAQALSTLNELTLFSAEAAKRAAKAAEHSKIAAFNAMTAAQKASLDPTLLVIVESAAKASVAAALAAIESAGAAAAASASAALAVSHQAEEALLKASSEAAIASRLAADSAAEAVKLSNQARDIENMIIK